MSSFPAEKNSTKTEVSQEISKIFPEKPDVNPYGKNAKKRGAAYLF
jgi:hypothetical protein